MKGFALLQYYIKYSNKGIGLFDINKVCEPFFCELFNILWNKKYERLEHKKKNFAGIDLGDNEKKLSVQITVNGKQKKLYDTIEMFEKHKHYKKYNKLIHFVVGEKRSISSKNPYHFRKDFFDIYTTERNIENYIYEVQVWDLNDLINFIDAADNSTVSLVSEYINNNIDTQVDKFRQRFYEIEANKLIPFTAESFLVTSGLTEKNEKKEMYNRLKDLYETLNYLQENTRRFIYVIIEVYEMNPNKYGSGNDIVANPDVVASHLGMKNINDEEFIKECTLLAHFDILDEVDMSEFRILCLPELFTFVREFCKEKRISMKDLILKPDFSLLD